MHAHEASEIPASAEGRVLPRHVGWQRRLTHIRSNSPFEVCAGFRAGTGNAHHLHNETAEEVLYLEIGDRTPEDHVTYPDDDLQFVRLDGESRFVHKNGTPY